MKAFQTKKVLTYDILPTLFQSNSFPPIRVTKISWILQKYLSKPLSHVLIVVSWKKRCLIGFHLLCVQKIYNSHQFKIKKICSIAFHDPCFCHQYESILSASFVEYKDRSLLFFIKQTNTCRIGIWLICFAYIINEYDFWPHMAFCFNFKKIHIQLFIICVSWANSNSTGWSNATVFFISPTIT